MATETWVINENPNASTLPNTSINFTSNEMSFSSIHYFSSEDNPATILYGDTHAWSMGVWINEAFRTVIFETAPTDNLLAWLQANATKQESTPKVSVDLTTLPGWSSLSDGSHNITIVAKANGFKDSAPSAAVQVEKAATGYTINIITSQTYKEFPEENHYFKINGIASPTNYDGYVDSNGVLHGTSSFINARTISSYVNSGMGNRMIVNGIIYSRYGDTGSTFYEEGTEIEITSNQDITIYYYYD